MSLILFLKADQHDLFDAPVNVGPSVRGGKAVGAYTRTQKVAQRHPVFGEYSFKKPLHAAVAASGGVLHWSTSRKDVESRRDRMADNPAWANARIEKVTANTAHKYTTHTPDNRAPARNFHVVAHYEGDRESEESHISASNHAEAAAAAEKRHPDAAVRTIQEVADPAKAARDAADLDYAKNAPPDPDAAAMQRYAAGVRAEEARIVGHTWEDIQRGQQGGRLNKPVDTSKPVDHTLSDADKALIEKHGVEGLAAMGYHGTLDKYHRAKAAADKSFADALAARAGAPPKMVVFPKKPTPAAKESKPETRYKHHLIRRTNLGGMPTYTLFGKEYSRGRRMIGHHPDLASAKNHVDILQSQAAAAAKQPKEGKRIASSWTHAGISKMVNEYYFSGPENDITVDPDTLALQRGGPKGPPKGARVVKRPSGLFVFEATPRDDE